MTATQTNTTPIAGQAFEQFLSNKLENPEFRVGFERKLAKVKSIADIMTAIESVRADEGLAKAEVARRMERKPSAVSRLLGGTGANPTLDTLVDLVDALGLELDVRLRRQPTRPTASYSPLKVQVSV